MLAGMTQSKPAHWHNTAPTKHALGISISLQTTLSKANPVITTGVPQAPLHACMHVYVYRLSRQRTHLCISLDPYNTSLPGVQGWQPHAEDCKVRPTQVISLAGTVAAALQAAKGVH